MVVIANNSGSVANMGTWDLSVNEGPVHVLYPRRAPRIQNVGKSVMHWLVINPGAYDDDDDGDYYYYYYYY